MSTPFSLMRTGLATSIVLALAGLAPTATAAHGCAYVASGTATRLGEAHDVDLLWTGSFDCNGNGNPGWFTIEIRDADGGVALRDEFPGQEILMFVTNDECEEIVDPYVGFSTSPLSPMVIEGEQRINFCTQTVVMHYEGHYKEWELVLDVWAPL